VAEKSRRREGQAGHGEHGSASGAAPPSRLPIRHCARQKQPAYSSKPSSRGKPPGGCPPANGEVGIRESSKGKGEEPRRSHVRFHAFARTASSQRNRRRRYMERSESSGARLRRARPAVRQKWRLVFTPGVMPRCASSEPVAEAAHARCARQQQRTGAAAPPPAAG